LIGIVNCLDERDPVQEHELVMHFWGLVRNIYPTYQQPRIAFPLLRRRLAAIVLSDYMPKGIDLLLRLWRISPANYWISI
jgi:hypothetical protein